MTVDKIIKALKCCNSTDSGKCLKECPYYDYSANCSQKMINDTLDLINSQQAEIEKLNNITAQMDDFARSICDIRMSKGKAIADSTDLLTYIEDEKRKAVEDFADRLKSLFNADYHLDRYYRKAIDELAKEVKIKNDYKESERKRITT